MVIGFGPAAPSVSLREETHPGLYLLRIRRRQSVLGSKITGKWRVPFIVFSSWLLLHFLTIASDYIPFGYYSVL